MRIAAQGDDRRVLQHEQRIPNPPFLAQGDKLLLQFEAGGVVNRAELENGDHQNEYALRLRGIQVNLQIPRSARDDRWSEPIAQLPQRQLTLHLMPQLPVS